MKNIRLKIEYIGTNYCGFERQKNGMSIQEKLEDAIFKSLGDKTEVCASGRTDAGVHAMCQVVNFMSNSNIDVSRFPVIINHHLPGDIQVKEAKEVPYSFNSRKDAIKKTYIYKIFTGKNLSVFDKGRVLHFPYSLNFDLMAKASKLIEGRHDFSSFMASGSSAKTSVRTIFLSKFTRRGKYLIYTVTGNGFLYNMVRILVGTLLDVGRGKLSMDKFKLLLRGKRRQDAGKTVAPYGLYLKDVLYARYSPKTAKLLDKKAQSA